MIEKLPVKIKYSGKGVEDGSMELPDVVNSLHGFSNAYTKLVIYKKSESQHNIRINGIGKGSVDFLLEVVEFIGDHKETIQGMGTALSSAIGILGLFLKVIELTKHTKNKDFKAKAEGINSNNVVIQNCDNVTQVFPKEVYQIYQEGIIKQDLSKISAPIEKEKVESVRIEARKNDETIGASINLEERQYFEYESQETTTTKEMVITGSMISLNKEHNRGSFRLQDGTRITYRLKSDTPEIMYRHFSHRGLVRVKCIAHLDENLKPMQIDIFSIEELQLGLDL